MATHFYRVLRRRVAVVTTTLCGRMSDKSADGINSTTDPAKVTCKLCKRRMTQGGAP